MKKSIVILMLAVLFLSGMAFTEERSFGLGIILGEPTGLSLKKWIGKTTAIDAAVAWSFKQDSFHVHADYLLHNFSLFEVKKGKLLLYYGLGGSLSTEAEVRVGVRIPVGLSYSIEDTHLETFFEIAPLLDLTPGTEFSLMGGIGIRYFF